MKDSEKAEQKWPPIPTQQTTYFLESTEGHKRFEGLHIENSVLMRGIVFKVSRQGDGEIYLKICEVTEP